MKLLLYLLLLSLVPSAKAQSGIDHLFEKYQSGEEFCKTHDRIIGPEKGFKVQVPVDYQHPELGSTSIFAFWSEGKFNPRLPTILTFDGGPGGNSHGRAMMVEQFNQLHFDQRGIGCSRPQNVELYRSHKFYSSINTAKDALAIIDHLDLEKVSVFGGSYGTIPATLFSHLYQSRVRALVLEGTVFDYHSLHNDVITREMSKVYSRLPTIVQRGMKAYFNTSEEASELYSYVQELGYDDDAFGEMEKTLKKLFSDSAPSNISDIERVFSETKVEEQTLETEDEFTKYALQCQEFVRHDFTVPLFFVSAEGEYLFYPYPVDDQKNCLSMGFVENEVPYRADDYPVNVPVTYFHGSWDLAAAVTGAEAHYRSTAQGKAQLLIAERGGHMPSYQPMAESDSSEEKRLHQLMMQKALNGETINDVDVQHLNDSKDRVVWSSINKK